MKLYSIQAFLTTLQAGTVAFSQSHSEKNDHNSQKKDNKLPIQIIRRQAKYSYHNASLDSTFQIFFFSQVSYQQCNSTEEWHRDAHHRLQEKMERDNVTTVFSLAKQSKIRGQ